MQWDPALAMDVSELDEQHREILAHLHLLIDAIRRGCARDHVGRTLAFLRGHVASHFTAEETLMRAVAFPDLSSHQAEHERFVLDLQEVEMDHQRDGATPRLILRVKGYVSVWVREHLFQTDRALAVFLRMRS
jgi:hemerythrin